MKISCLSLAVLLLLCSFSLAQGQKETTGPQAIATPISTEKSKREILQEAKLKTLLSKAGVSVLESSVTNNQSQTYREVKIRWVSLKSLSSEITELQTSVRTIEQGPALSSSVVEAKKRLGRLPRHRSLELSPTHILIAAVDEKNQLRWWSIVPDPRVVRAEFQTSTGELRSENYYLSNLTLDVAFPDDPKIVNLRFYHPLWTGADFDLELLTIAPVQ